MYKSLFICDLDGCKKYLDSPVTLPCGNTICKSHIKFAANFQCSICEQEHKPIDENGFRINTKLSNIIDYDHHLDGTHKEAKVLYDKLNSKLNDFKQSDLADQDRFVYDYFADLRNQIDMHRDEMIEEIRKNSEKLLNQLSDLEKEVHENKNKVEKINYTDFINDDWKSTLRDPNIESVALNKIKSDLGNKIIEFDKKIKSFENGLKMNREIKFAKSDTNSFGRVEINEINKTEITETQLSLNQAEPKSSSGFASNNIYSAPIFRHSIFNPVSFQSDISRGLFK